MGLDMYLSAEKYVGNWKHNSDAEREIYRVISTAVGLKDFSCQGSQHLTVKMCVAYWRKSNMIHAWFVENCQDGKDECQHSYVSREQLEELQKLCAQVIETKDASLLPPRKGFYFGGTDVDDWYWDDVTKTRDMLKAILENKALEDCEFDYRASW